MDKGDASRRELVEANRILAGEGVLDAFGHVSRRSPAHPDRYLLARAVSPETVTVKDILDFTLDSTPVDPATPASYAERVVHGCAYRLRPDIDAVCHFHSDAILPFCITDTPLVPVTHVGATVGGAVPVWSAKREFGDTNLLVSTQEEGMSLARALGSGWAVLMENHGAVVAGRSLREAVFRTIQLCRNAENQFRAMQMGKLKPLSAREVELAGEFNLREPVLERAWNYWMHRLAGRTACAAAD